MAGEKRFLVTGGAGFIGSNLVETLVQGNQVDVLDNFSAVDDRYIRHLKDRKGFGILKKDITRETDFDGLGPYDTVFHLAADSDVRGGMERPTFDFRVNAEGTLNVLEFMRKRDIKEIVFASSSTVYGEAERIPTPEDYGPYMPISSYGASKMAAEGFISAYSHYYGIRGTIFRFANIVGRNSTHGVIFDFIMKLKKDSRHLEILGDGTQRKSYMHVSDCVNSMNYVHGRSSRTDIYNLGNEGTTSVRKIADTVAMGMGLSGVSYRFTGGEEGRGWKGDVKIAELAVKKLLETGWKNKYSSDESVRVSVDEVIRQVHRK
ncbi:MAG: NAD-dependent epimerase/dehydratase family protein [Methanomassiliicoccales archaeon]|nr:NAD-dependent epimerase/dehydratase family protein [Methanomassiliicoccales archaeon]